MKIEVRDSGSLSTENARTINALANDVIDTLYAEISKLGDDNALLKQFEAQQQGVDDKKNSILMNVLLIASAKASAGILATNGVARNKSREIFISACTALFNSEFNGIMEKIKARDNASIH